MAVLKIKPVPGYKAQPGPGGPGPKVSKVVVKKPAPKKVLDPFGVPHVTPPGGTGFKLPPVSQSAPLNYTPPPPVGPAAPGAAVGVPRSAAPGNYLPSLADITGNPLYEQALGQYNTNMQSLMRALQGSFGQSVIKSGYDPTAAFQQLMKDRPDLGEFSSLLDPAAAAAAGANPLSQRAMNEQAFTRGSENQAYELAARGMGQSGAAATGTNALTQARQLAENQSRDALLEALQGGITGYLGQKTEGYNRVQDVAAQVAELLAQQQGPVYGEADESHNEAEGVAGGMSPADEVVANPNTVPGTAIPSAANTNFITWGGTPGAPNKIYNVGQMQQWLAAHGGNWNQWKNAHPDAAAKLLALS